VDETGWQGSGPEFTLGWNARRWILRVDERCPGLRLNGTHDHTKLLALDRLAGATRHDLEAFNSKTLVEYERYRHSVRATFAPPSWGGLRVRASWSVAPGDSVDLEVQITASSVGELEGLEVAVVSHLDSGPCDEGAKTGTLVESLASAPASPSKGRDSTDLSPSDAQVVSAYCPLSPSLIRAPGGPDDLYYAEMAHPDDLARRISPEPLVERSTAEGSVSMRYSLFGLALEKGVVLRARLRACWIRSRNPAEAAAMIYQAFLREPPPLGP
jgi:hypothetical protein